MKIDEIIKQFEQYRSQYGGDTEVNLYAYLKDNTEGESDVQYFNLSNETSFDGDYLDIQLSYE